MEIAWECRIPRFSSQNGKGPPQMSWLPNSSVTHTTPSFLSVSQWRHRFHIRKYASILIVIIGNIYTYVQHGSHRTNIIAHDILIWRFTMKVRQTDSTHMLKHSSRHYIYYINADIVCMQAYNLHEFELYDRGARPNFIITEQIDKFG